MEVLEDDKQLFEANRRLGRCMRVCQNCGVGIGIMALGVFEKKYRPKDDNGKIDKQKAQACPICGRPAGCKIERPSSGWLPASVLSEKYGIPLATFDRLRIHNLIPYMTKDGSGNGASKYQYRERSLHKALVTLQERMGGNVRQESLDQTTAVV